MSSGALEYGDVVASRLDRLAEAAYATVADDVEQFFAGRNAGPRDVIKEGRIVVCGDGSCRYRSIQPYSGESQAYRQVPLDTEWTGYCEAVYAPLEATAAHDGELPRRVSDALAGLEPGAVEPGDLAPVRRWLRGREQEPVAERTVYRG